MLCLSSYYIALVGQWTVSKKFRLSLSTISQTVSEERILLSNFLLPMITVSGNCLFLFCIKWGIFIFCINFVGFLRKGPLSFLDPLLPSESCTLETVDTWQWDHGEDI